MNTFSHGAILHPILFSKPMPSPFTRLLRPAPILSISTLTTIPPVATMSSSTPTTSTSTSTTWPTTRYAPRHTTWPYHPSDFLRQDPTPDPSFYSTPRFVTHIDGHAIAVLKSYYASVLPRRGRILDFCSSWISHYPQPIEQAVERGELQVVGMGLNQQELDANPVLDKAQGRVVRDLNEDPDMRVPVAVGGGDGDGDVEGGGFDAATCVVSIDYLTRPVEVLRSLGTVVKPRARVHLVVSNRCFPTKAVRRWLEVDEAERLLMVGDYLHFAGWRDIEIVDLNSEDQEEIGSGIARFMRGDGVGGHNPLWVVRGVKRED